MPRAYTFAVPDRPRPKERPRMTRRGHVFTPKTTLEYEQRIADAYSGPNWDGPVCVEIDYWGDHQVITIRNAVVEKSPLRGDIDNYLKATLDGLQKCAFENDRQVMEVWASKQ